MGEGAGSSRCRHNCCSLLLPRTENKKASHPIGRGGDGQHSMGMCGQGSFRFALIPVINNDSDPK